jgi:hypothetical protein
MLKTCCAGVKLQTWPALICLGPHWQALVSFCTPAVSAHAFTDWLDGVFAGLSVLALTTHVLPARTSVHTPAVLLERSEQHAQNCVATDPAVHRGRFVLERRRWLQTSPGPISRVPHKHDFVVRCCPFSLAHVAMVDTGVDDVVMVDARVLTPVT